MLHYSALCALAALTSSTSAVPHVVPPPVVVAPSAAPTPDPAAVAEAIRLLDAEGFDQEAVRGTELAMGAMLAGMVEQIRKVAGDQVPEDFIAQLKQTLHDHAVVTMQANLPAMKRESAEIYAQEFTTAELIHLRELAADPVLTKARQRNSVIEPKLMENWNPHHARGPAGAGREAQEAH